MEKKDELGGPIPQDFKTYYKTMVIKIGDSLRIDLEIDIDRHKDP